MNNVLKKRFGFLLFALATSFNFLASVPDLNSNDLFKIFYNENKLENCLPEKIKTDATLFEHLWGSLHGSDSGISEEIVYDGKVNNDNLSLRIKTIFFKNYTMTRYFTVSVYKENSEEPYYFTSVALENKNLSLDYYSPAVFPAMNANEILNFINKFFNENFVSRVNMCRSLDVMTEE